MINNTKKDKKYTPVNKGHSYGLETKERMDEFNKKLSQGWETEYKEYRKLWEDLPQKRIVRDYPLLVDLETVSRCNLSCPMCPTVTQEFKDKRIAPFKRGQMNTELAKKIIDEVAGKIYSLRLSWIGEPTLHSGLVGIIKYAKEKNIKEVSFLTNGYKLHMDYFLKLVDAGIDIITISIDGMDETYNKIRKPLKFNETLKKLRDISKYKKDNNLNKPLIKIQGVWPAVKENPEKFYNTFSPIVDLIAFNPLIDYLHKDKDIVYEDDNFSCPQHYQRITIGSNGKATMCSNDDFMNIDIGDASKTSIHKLWHGEALNKIRRLHEKKNGFKEIDACKNCYYPRKMEEDEKAVINGREVRIENYINRSQEIGK